VEVLLMEAIIDKFGRIVIPKEIRDTFGLRPGSSLQIEEDEQAIILKPLAGTPHLKSENGWLVFTGELQGDISDIIENVRKDRIDQVSGMKK